MGWGDEVIATAQARRLQMADPRKVAIRGKNGMARWHFIWDHNPRLIHPDDVNGANVQWLENYSGHRPYINYEKHSKAKYTWNDFRVEPGEIYLSRGEKAHAARTAGAVVIEPHCKPGAPINKHWGMTRWHALVRKLKDYELVQLGPLGTEILPGVRHVVTNSVREGCGALSGARAAVLPEGGLHHAAAALGVPAVVIFGGYISPKTTGYDLHANIFTGGHACGNRTACGHCGEAMAAIQPSRVAAELQALLERQPARQPQQENAA